MLIIKRALLSVFDKSGLLDLASFLKENKIEIISSGGTAKYLVENGIDVMSVESVTGSREILNGRVKTLNPKIHGGILALRDNLQHQLELQDNGIAQIDLVVVNLYPFEQVINKPSVSHEEAIENIDIGGPSMLRSAAKNYSSVAVLSSPEQYKDFIENYKSSSLTQEKLLSYAVKAFKRTSEYDKNIFNYFEPNLESKISKSPEISKLKSLELEIKQELRYGENPHQKAVLYSMPAFSSLLPEIKQLHGKELSYNNWLDIEAAYNLISEFEPEIATCAIIKHNIPCGVAVGDSILEAYEHALDSDPVSAFGGIVALNKEVDEETAKLMSRLFLEVIVAPSFSEGALKFLCEKKNLRLLQVPILSDKENEENKIKLSFKSIFGEALLCQEEDDEIFNKEELKVVTKTEPEPEDWLGLLFGFRVAKHVKSNGIVVINENRTVGICGGQTNRVNAVRIALENASDLAKGAILASDGFFPFADNMELIAQAGIKAVIQPGGSIRDQEVIDKANEHGVSMVFTGIRHFKH